MLSVYHVINVVQIDKTGQLFIYDDQHRTGADANSLRSSLAAAVGAAHRGRSASKEVDC